MPRTIVPEEQRRADDLNDLKNNIRPTPNRTVQVKSDADGAPNFFVWDGDADPNNADGQKLIQTTFSNFPSGTPLNGLWRRVEVPFSSVTTDDLAEGSENKFFTPERVKNQFQAGGDISYDKDLFTPYDLANASDANETFDVSLNENFSFSVELSKDGTKLYVLGGDQTVDQYILNTPFDVSSATTIDTTFDVSGEGGFPNTIEFNGDGTKMFIGENAGQVVFQYDLGTGFDVSTASFNSKSFDVSAQVSNLNAVAFSNDGTKMFVTDRNTSKVYEYLLASPFDLSSSVSFANRSLDVSGQESDPRAMDFNGDGTRIFVAGSSNTQIIYEYDLGTAFDLSTSSFNNQSFSTGTAGLTGQTFSSDGTKLYTIGVFDNAVETFNTVSGGGKATFSLDVSALTPSELFGSKTTDDLPEGSTNLYFTDERAQDRIGSVISSGTGVTTVNYNDAGDSITIETTDEAIQDAVYNTALNGTQTLIDVTYDDANGEVDYAVETDASQFDFSNVTTDDIDEGSSNLYSTSSRVRDELQAGGDIEYSKNLLNVFDLANASFTNTSFDVSSEDTIMLGIEFNNDGSKLFGIGAGGDNVYEYDLSTNFDISSATFSKSFDVDTGAPKAVTFNGDGTKMFVIGSQSNDIYEYNLTTAFDVGTATLNQSISSGFSATRVLTGLDFSDDGSKMYVSERDGNAFIHQYDLTTNFDISTASITTSFDVSSQDGNPTGVEFNGDGTELFFSGTDNGSIYKYDLTTAFDVSTASYSGTSFVVSSQDSNVRAVEFNNDGTKMFTVGFGTDTVYAYDTGSAGGGGGGGLAEFNLDVSSLTASELFGSKTTGDLPDGSSNLYYTDERAQDAVGPIFTGAGGVSVSYNDSTNEIAVSAQGTSLDISEDGGTVLQNAGTVDFGQGISVSDAGSGSALVQSDAKFETQSFDGDGIQKEFSFNHGLGAEPSQVVAEANGDDASGLSHVNANGTSITAVYDTAPPAGTGNVEIDFAFKQ